MTWFGIAASPVAVERFLGVGAATLNLFLDYGPFAFLLFTFPAMLLVSLRHGLRLAVVVAGALACFGNVIRLLPGLLHTPQSLSASSMSASSSSAETLPFVWMVLLHIGQILVSSGGAVAGAAVTLLSFSWFSESGRSTATSVAWQSSNFGFSIAFVVVPLLAPSAPAVPRMLIVLCIVSALPFVISTVYFPRPVLMPPTDEPTKVKFLPGVQRCLKNPSMILCMIAGGVQNGVYGAWVSVLPQSLATLGYDPTTAGWLGFGCTLACIAGSVVVGFIADKWLANQPKHLAMGVWGCAIASFTWLAVALQFRLCGNVVIGVSLVLVGLCQGGITPMFFDMAAEITLPINQGTSAGLITLSNNVVSGLFLAISAKLSVPLFNTIVIGTFVLCACCTIPIRIPLRTSFNAVAAESATKEGV